VPTITEFTIEIMTGLAMRVLLTGDLDRNRILQHRWRNAVRILLGQADPETLTDPPPESIAGRPGPSSGHSVSPA
jgi:hypothetical protein